MKRKDKTNQPPHDAARSPSCTAASATTTTTATTSAAAATGVSASQLERENSICPPNATSDLGFTKQVQRSLLCLLREDRHVPPTVGRAQEPRSSVSVGSDLACSRTSRKLDSLFVAKPAAKHVP